MAELEPQGRMAQLLISVKDPVELEQERRSGSAMVLDAYVRAEIEGGMLQGVAPVPRPALRDGNQVWVMSPEKTLDVRTVRIAWGNKDSVFANEGLNDGEFVVMSDIPAPVSGMALQLVSEAALGLAEPGSDWGKEGAISE
jgi:hypothetical protein